MMKLDSSCMPIKVVSIALFTLLNVSVVNATSTGISGYSGNNNGPNCDNASCHTGGIPPDVKIEGPNTVAANTLNLYKITMTGGQDKFGGVDVSTDAGSLRNKDADTKIIGTEITHRSGKATNYDGTTISWVVNWLAPNTVGMSKLYATALSADGSKDQASVPTATGDGSTKATPFAVSVVNKSDLPANSIPKAKISSPFTFVVGDEILLLASKSLVYNGFINSYEWSFSDGTSNIVGEQIKKSFLSTGKFTITLTVKTDKNEIDTTFIDIEVVPLNDPSKVIPRAKISSPVTAVVATTVVFDASRSTPAVNNISFYYWDFGDGTNYVEADSAKTTVSHIYSTEGDYIVTLAVQGRNGLTDIDSFTIKIGAVGTGGTGGTGQAKTGLELYTSNCLSCHGAAGIGAANSNNRNIKGATPKLISGAITKITTMNNIAVTTNEMQKIADYLGSGAAVTGMPTDSISDGLSLYNVKCLLCHGVDALGVPSLGGPKQGAAQSLILTAIDPNRSPTAIGLMLGIQLTTQEASLIAEYLKSLLPASGNLTAGKAVFIRECQMCHGTGEGGQAKGVLGATVAIIETFIQNIPSMQNIVLSATEKLDLAAFLLNSKLARPTTGPKLFEMYCSYCHGLDAKGGAIATKNITNNGFIGQDIMNAYSNNGDGGDGIAVMTNTKLIDVRFTTIELDRIATFLDPTVGNGG